MLGPPGARRAREITIRAENDFLSVTSKETEYEGRLWVVPAILALLDLTMFLHIWSRNAPRIDLDVKWIWAILALMSALTLSYVRMINGLRDKRKELEEKHDWDRYNSAVNIIRMLAWTCTYSFVAIAGLTIRIVLEFVGKDIPRLLDSLIVASFTIGSFIRIAIFYYSYHTDFLVKKIGSEGVEKKRKEKEIEGNSGHRSSRV